MMFMLLIWIWKSGYSFGAHRECAPETSVDQLAWVGMRWFIGQLFQTFQACRTILTYCTFKPINCHSEAAETICKHKPYIFTSTFTLIWLISSAIINLLASSRICSHAELQQRSSSNIDVSFDFFLEKYVQSANVWQNHSVWIFFQQMCSLKPKPNCAD